MVGVYRLAASRWTDRGVGREAEGVQGVEHASIESSKAARCGAARRVSRCVVQRERRGEERDCIIHRPQLTRGSVSSGTRRELLSDIDRICKTSARDR